MTAEDDAQDPSDSICELAELCLVRSATSGLPGTTVQLQGDKVTIGRDAQCDMQLSDHLVSRFHAVVQRVDEDRLLRDLGSTNGTFLNGLRLGPEQAFPLRAGDVVEIGPERLFVAERSATVADAAAPGSAPEDAVADLIREGAAGLPPGDLLAMQREILLGFAQSIGQGLRVALELVRGRLQAHVVVLFRADEASRFKAAFVQPPTAGEKHESLGDESLSTLATQAWLRREGLLVHGHAGALPGPGETCVQGQWSAAAVPLDVDEGPAAVLVVGRTGKARLDRRDLALLAVLADRISLGLAIPDTRDRAE